ncbi:MAG: tetratricopeptide repeat protein [Actinomycetota bacterium]|nr:tetratricopeptide repeat protein [Actinomycetota bacterium]
MAGGELPEGTLTMLFTDIEGSTVLVQRLGVAWGEVLSEQRRIMRAAIAAHGGREMGTEGDSFFVVFRTARGGVQAALRAQQELELVQWPDGAAVRVRMGLHTGEPERHEDGYVGLDVHRAARVAASAHGGQVVLTEPTWAMVAGALDGLSARDLGRHRLKDIPLPEHLYQLCAQGLADDFARVRSMGSRESLPRPATRLIGRDDQVAQALDLLERGVGRLVTLIGPGGVGKTRLATAVAAARAEGLAGVYFVPLAEATTAEDVWSSLAEVLGAPSESKDPPGFVRYLGDERLLVVLDNLEHIDGVGTVVGELLTSCPGLEVLATSRRPLHLAQEHLLTVEPLEPAAARELFAERIGRLRGMHRQGTDDEAAVVELCERLDRLPLAIELLAARGQLLGPRAMLSRLRSGLELRARSVDLPQRQQSLAAALDWSIALLDDESARLFTRLGVFAGSFQLQDAVRVVDLPEDDVLDQLLELVEASLVGVTEEPGGEPRFQLLQTVASYALARLTDSDTEQAEAVHRRHSGWIAELVSVLYQDLRTGRHHLARDRLVAQQGNIRAALEWTLEREGEDFLTGLRICQEMGWYWYACGYQAEGRRWLAKAAAPAARLRSAPAAALLHSVGVLIFQEGDAGRAAALFEQSLEYWRSVGDRSGQSRELNSLGLARRSLGDFATARTMLGQAVSLAREEGAQGRLSNALSNLALLEVDEGRPHRALELLEEVLAIDLELGDPWGIGACRVNIAGAHLVAGRPELAEAILLEHGPEALSLGDVELGAEVLENLAAVCAARGMARTCALAVGAAQATRSAAGVPLPPPDAAAHETALAPVRGQPTPEEWADALTEGAGLSVDEAFTEVVKVLTAHC